jgi:hypothetical protein
MKKFKVKERDNVKNGRSYLMGGISFIFLGLILSIWTINTFKSFIDEAVHNPHAPDPFNPMWMLPMSIMTFLFIFGYFYFIWGLYKLKNAIKEISNKFLIFYGSISYILYSPLFLSGFMISILCNYYRCEGLFSVLDLILISLSIILLISSLVSFFIEIRKISGATLENYLKEKMEENTLPPITRRLYKVRIEIKEEDIERINYICGNCGEKNRFKTLDEKSGIMQCIKCGSDNYLEQ